ncbi:MAG: P-loop NTPase [Bacillota bacterium]|nr:P-loop NTPase [Bacillota bacterium]
MAHPGWLSNKVFQVEVTGRGSFLTRVLGIRKDIVVVSAPASGTELTWLPKDTRLLLKLMEPAGEDGPDAALRLVGSAEATVVDRKLKPMPILFLRLTQDLPFAAAVAERRNRIVVVTSGKGGTGKTFIAVNLAYAWGKAGLRVALLDGDIGTANVATALGLRPETDLGAVISGRLRLEETALPSSHGITVFPGAIGDAVGADLSPWQFSRIVAGIAEIEARFDQVIVDTGAGISRNVTGLLYVADFIVLVVNDTPTSIVDAYALIKQVSSQFWIPEVGLVVNRVLEPRDETAVRRFIHTARQYLSVPVVFLGYIQEDLAVLRSLKAGSPVLAHAPGSGASRDLEAVAATLQERLLHTADARHLRPG